MIGGNLDKDNAGAVGVLDPHLGQPRPRPSSDVVP
jgi:hypothetical protein